MQRHTHGNDAARSVVGLVVRVAVFVIAAQQAWASEDPNARPNIIFILADDLGYGDLGCYGQKKIRTPNLDRMAAEGMRFTQAYAGSCACAPSRCCLLTGYHTGHAFVRTNDPVPLRPEDETVAEVLKFAGYATGAVGKWGLGLPGTTGIPNKQGFDEWFGYLDQARAHDYYPDCLWQNERKVSLAGNQGGQQGEYSHDRFTDVALDFVRRHRDRPFFLYVPYTIPHANTTLGHKTGMGMQVPDDAPYTSQPWPQAQKNHAAMITRMDRDVGRLLDLLNALRLDKRTIVFFSSDNGPHGEGGADPNFFDSNGPLRGMKRDMYEGGIRVPFIVRWPGRIDPGVVSNHVVAFWDFMPTVAELAGLTPPSGIDGMSILPVLLGQEQQGHAYLYWERPGYRFDRAVRFGDWKAVRHGANAPIQLYNLKDDPGEQKNLASERPDALARAEELFAAARVDSREFPILEGRFLWRRRHTYGGLAMGAVVLLGIVVVWRIRRKKSKRRRRHSSRNRSSSRHQSSSRHHRR